MKTLWLITNPASGSASPEKCDAIETVCAERGIRFAGRTRFPDDALPSAADLERASADTVLLFAGDGTINAALRALEGWNGAILILPGGTMNMLARRLHGTAEAGDIVHAAHKDGRETRLSYVEAEGERAFVGMIAGPVAAWAGAREAVRDGDLAALPAKASSAWSESWSRDVAVHSEGRLLGTFNAVFVEPYEGRLAISGIAAEGVGDLARLGLAWIAGDWRAAPAVDDCITDVATLSSEGDIKALFDGEEAALPSPATLRAGTSALRFLTTAEPALTPAS